MPKEITGENFEKEVLKSDMPVAVDYWAPWCGPCKMMAPVFEKVAKKMTKVKFGKVNVDKATKLAHENGILSIPCIVVYNKGDEAGRIVGFMSEDQLKKRIENLI